MKELEKEIGEFAEIDAGLYRGAQPTDKGLELLKEKGIKTIINFRHEQDVIEKEKEFVASLGGIDYVSIPWRIQLHPENQPMTKFLKTLETAEKPIFFHCRRGAERTGVADAIYKHFVQKIPMWDSYEKATKPYNTKWIWRPFIKKRFEQFVEDIQKS